MDAGPDASPSLPIGLKTLFLEVIQGTNDVVESKNRLLVAVGNACLSSKISGFILPSHHPALNASNLSFPERATSRFNKLVEQAWEGERCALRGRGRDGSLVRRESRLNGIAKS